MPETVWGCTNNVWNMPKHKRCQSGLEPFFRTLFSGSSATCSTPTDGRVLHWTKQESNGFFFETRNWADQATMHGRSQDVASFKIWPFLSSRFLGTTGALQSRAENSGIASFCRLMTNLRTLALVRAMHTYVHEQEHSHSTTHSDEELFLVRVSSDKATVRAATEPDERQAGWNRQGFV